MDKYIEKKRGGRKPVPPSPQKFAKGNMDEYIEKKRIGQKTCPRQKRKYEGIFLKEQKRDTKPVPLSARGDERMEKEIFYRKWEVSSPCYALYLVHGMGEHCGRYEHVAKFLNERGVAVYSGDLPGYGRTPGRRGDVASFGEITEAVFNGWKRMCAETPSIPHFLLGHSMGGLTVLHLLLTHGEEVKPDGVILSSPALKTKVAIPRWKERLAKVLTPILPTLTLPSGISSTDVSRDPQVVEGYGKDPYVHSLISLRMYGEFTRTMADVFANAEKLPSGFPFLVMQAGADLLVDPATTKAFAGRIPSHPGHRYKEWPQLYHEILNEPEKEEVMEEMWRFMQEAGGGKGSVMFKK